MDPEFDEQEKKLRQLQARLEKTRGEVAKLVEGLQLLALQQGRCGEALEVFYENVEFDKDEALRPSGVKYSFASRGVETSLKSETERAVKKCVADPLDSLDGLLNELSGLVGKRGRKLLDYDAARSKTKKLLEKDGMTDEAAGQIIDGMLSTSNGTAPFSASNSFMTPTSPGALSPPGSPIPESAGSGARSPVIPTTPTTASGSSKAAKSQSALLEAYAAYAKWNSTLLAELPRVFDLRTAYVEPEVEALCSTLRQFADDFAQLLEPVYETSEVQGDLEAQLEAISVEMDGLAICGGKL